MSEYLILPIVEVSIDKPATITWKLPSVAQLLRVVPLVDTPMQARVIAKLPCSLQLAHYTMADVELRHLEDATWLRNHVGHHLVMKAGDDIVLGLGELQQGLWRVREVSLLTIVRLPPSCYTPRESV